MNFKNIVHGVWKTHSLLRIYQDDLVSKIKIKGNGIDLGAKSSNAPYYAHMQLNDVSSMEFVDFFHADENVIKMNLEEPFPINSEKYDFILAFNILEHLFDFSTFTKESNRILKENGEMHLMVPFFVYYHPDPKDYFRYTGESLYRIMKESGFDIVDVRVIASGPFKVAVSQVAKFFKFRPIVFLIYMFGFFMDYIVSRVAKRQDGFPLGYYVFCKKTC